MTLVIRVRCSRGKGEDVQTLSRVDVPHSTYVLVAASGVLEWFQVIVDVCEGMKHHKLVLVRAF